MVCRCATNWFFCVFLVVLSFNVFLVSQLKAPKMIVVSSVMQINLWDIKLKWRTPFDAIIRLTTLQRWQPFFSLSRLSRYSFVLLVFAFNIATGAVIGKLSTNHKEWYVVVPLTGFFACFWLCFQDYLQGTRTNSE
jgi:hypothetical protein